jgi:hypothetical protein
MEGEFCEGEGGDDDCDVLVDSVSLKLVPCICWDWCNEEVVSVN